MNWNTHGAESQRVLICLHGFMGDGRDWDAFAKIFTKHMPEWLVAAPTLPGHEDGGSSPGDWDVAAAICEWMDSRGIKEAVLAGYSLGGRLGMRLALDNPERFPVFVGISTTAGIDAPEERDARRVSDLALAKRLRCCGERESFSAFLEEWWDLPVFASPSSRDAHRMAFVESRLKKSPVALAAAIEQWSPGALPSLWDCLEEYPGKVLLLSGEADAKYTTISDRMLAIFRHAVAHRFIGAGHQLLIECPGEVAAIVAGFLNEEQFQAAKK